MTASRVTRENQLNGQVFDRYLPDFRVTDLPDTVSGVDDRDQRHVDLTSRGLPFFAGRATLYQNVYLTSLGARVVLEIRGLHAAVARVRVNGEEMGTVAWPPNQVDITKGVVQGQNAVAIELISTLRNLLGPHHRVGGDTARTGPADFRDKENWTDDYVLVPFGFDGVTIRVLEL